MQIFVFKNPNEVTANHIVYGMAAGFIASLVLAVVIELKNMLSFYVAYDVLAVQANAFRYEGDIFANWIIHFIIGTFVWGTLYGLINQRLIGTLVEKGTAFGVLIWLIAMITLMPMAHVGFFITTYGFAAMAISLVFHLIFGLVQAHAYSQLSKA